MVPPVVEDLTHVHGLLERGQSRDGVPVVTVLHQRIGIETALERSVAPDRAEMPDVRGFKIQDVVEIRPGEGGLRALAPDILIRVHEAGRRSLGTNRARQYL